MQKTLTLAEFRQAAAGKACLFAMQSIRQELHSAAMRKPIPRAVNRRQLATMRACLFRMQPINAAWPSMARRNHAATDPCRENRRHAAQCMQLQAGYANSPRIALYRLCKIALYPPAQHVVRAVCGHFKRFSGFPVNVRQCSARHSRPAARS